jgi:hypothetical protein
MESKYLFMPASIFLSLSFSAASTFLLTEGGNGANSSSLIGDIRIC